MKFMSYRCLWRSRAFYTLIDSGYLRKDRSIVHARWGTGSVVLHVVNLQLRRGGRILDNLSTVTTDLEQSDVILICIAR